MNKKLNSYEARIIGVLIEKELTTPDQYPLSLNALTNACNQKSNREPVLDLSESVVQDIVDGLCKRYLVSRASGFGSRVTKYQHRFCNTEFGELKLSPQEVAVLCELLLRGPQTPGELRSRADRLCSFRDVSEVEQALEALRDRDEPLVAKLSRIPGKRESRYGHCLDEEAVPAEDTGAMTMTEAVAPASIQSRLESLEKQLADMQAVLHRLQSQFETLAGPLDP
jgi:uncharacterized protein